MRTHRSQSPFSLFLGFLLWISALVAAPALAAPDAEPVNRIVAVVNDDVVLATELADELQQVRDRLDDQNTALPPTDVLRRQVLERLILQRLQLQRAKQAGLQVDETELDRALARIAEQNNLSLPAFRQILVEDGVDFERFRERIRREILISQVQQKAVGNRVNVTEEDIAQFQATRKTQEAATTEYRLGHILVAVPEGADSARIQEARAEAERVLARLQGGADFREVATAESDGQQALQGGDLGWRRLEQIPSVFVDAAQELEPGEVAGPIRSPSGFHIVSLLDQRGGSQQAVTQTHARHILLKPDGADGNAQERLRQLRQRIQNGANFAALAQAHSEDPGSAARGGDLGWLNPGDTVPAFERALADLQPGEVSEPFQSRFGWHIAQVLERRQMEDTAAFERTAAVNAIRERKVEEALDLWLRRLRDDAYVDVRLES